MGKIIIVKKNNRLLLTLFDEKKPCLMETSPFPDEESILGNIYLAKVKDVVPGINGAFLSAAANQTVYLPLEECKEVLIANRELKDGESLKQGDEIVVQITGEALKTKQPSSSARLTLTGQYCVCSFFGHGLHYSKKISEEKRKCIDDAVKAASIEGRRKYRFTIRTNADALSDFSALFEEMESFIKIFNLIEDTYNHRTCYTCFYRREPEIVNQIKNISLGDYEEIVTDDRDTYELLMKSLSDRPVRFYQDAMLSLAKLYSIDTYLQEALSKKVWLPCGGYLIIEPTEAMVVIDVNSGKADSKGKKSADYYLKVNLEAAKETARQLRIRNYSGMILVDFINMESKDDNQKLLDFLDACLKEDKVRTRLVDMTALGIVEITRKKVSSPLSRWISLTEI